MIAVRRYLNCGLNRERYRIYFLKKYFFYESRLQFIHSIRLKVHSIRLVAKNIWLYCIFTLVVPFETWTVCVLRGFRVIRPPLWICIGNPPFSRVNDGFHNVFLNFSITNTRKGKKKVISMYSCTCVNIRRHFNYESCNSCVIIPEAKVFDVLFYRFCMSFLLVILNTELIK